MLRLSSEGQYVPNAQIMTMANTVFIRLTTTYILFLFSSCMLVEKICAAEDITTSIHKKISQLETKFGIPILYKNITPAKGVMQYTLTPEEGYPILNNYLELFTEEINKYPSGFFTKKKIQAIVLVERLFKGETAAEGAYNSLNSVMAFDILRSDRNAAQQRHSIHHEIFHMMALQTDSMLLDKPYWESININGFVYGKQTTPASQTNPVNPYAPNQLGFVTYYAMEAVAEDQAEVFACLMQKNHYRLIEEWQKNDRYLKKKIEAIKAFAKDYDPDLNENYWKQLNQ